MRYRRLALTAMLSATALVLSYLEAMLPLPVSLPGVKLGLANIAVIVAFCVGDWRLAGAVAMAKVLASGLLFGSPTMLAYSLGGTTLSFAGMALMMLVPGMGLIPVSMVAAILHNAGQLMVAALMLRTPGVFVNLPVLAVAACVTGLVTGSVAEAAITSLEGVEGETERPHIEGELELTPGEWVAFVGVNGSGKTSFALQLVRKLGPDAAGMALQDPNDQIVAAIVRDDVAFGLENRGVEPGRMRREVASALREVGLGELSAREVATLSGGQKQLVAIAGLLAVEPGVIVFDESTSMLDPVAREEFSGLVEDLTDRGLAVVQITQRMEEAFEADRIVVFSECRIVGAYAPDALLAHPEVLEASGLELPRVARMAAWFCEGGFDVALTSDMDELADALAGDGGEGEAPC